MLSVLFPDHSSSDYSFEVSQMHPGCLSIYLQLGRLQNRCICLIYISNYFACSWLLETRTRLLHSAIDFSDSRDTCEAIWKTMKREYVHQPTEVDWSKSQMVLKGSGTSRTVSAR